jgi:hypothetical protein
MADEIRKDFAMTYADLIGVCDSVHSSMVRDASEMTAYGITALTLSSFKTKIDEFLAFPTDSNLASDIISATQNKNNIASDLMIMLRSFGTRAKLVFSTDNGKMDKFILKDLSHATDNNLLVFAEMVGLNSEKFKTELAAAGLTQQMIDDLNDLTDTFRLALNAKDDAVKARDEGANSRFKKANELYGLLSKYCEVGKTIWYETNEAKYNDYIIYTYTSPGSLTAPRNLRYNTQYYKIEWDAVENATSYQLENSSDGVNYSELVSQSETEFSFIPYENHNYFRVRARNSAGYGEYSAVLQFWYYEPLPAPSNFQAIIIPGHQYKLTWDLIHSVETYKIYISDVPFGEPESSFTLLYETSALEYTGSVTPGRRFYFKITSNNSYQPESSYSSTEYVEVTGGMP